MSTVEEQQARLIIRNAELADVPAVRRFFIRVYGEQDAYSAGSIRGQINAFPEGQFVAVYEGEVIGYASSFRIGAAKAFAPHDWRTISGNGYAALHDPNGNYLYGLEVSVDPAFRGQRIGQRLYQARQRLAQDLGLNGIVFGGRMPGFSEHEAEFDGPEDYIEAVKENRLRDPVLSFQVRNGFEIRGVLKNYLPSDVESRGHAALMVWSNPDVVEEAQTVRQTEPGRAQDTIRVSLVQYQQRRVGSFEEFAQNVEYFVDVVADYQSDFVVFPELFTLQLLSIENREIPASEAIAELSKYTERLKDLLRELAVSYNINIIGGSHPTETEDGSIHNICYVALRDGSIHSQEKLHPTPNERYWWQIEGGDGAEAIMTDCGPIGVMICYDSEFPELARHLVDQGARMLFVPFCTDERQSYLRVRYCAQARAVENQCYVVMAGNVGNLPGVANMDIQYAQSCILTPCDFPFARDGIAADTTPNVEMVAFADLSLPRLEEARQNGTVQNLKDRRFDLYANLWRGN